MTSNTNDSYLDGYALVEAIYAPFSPAWLRDLPTRQALRVMLVQNY